MAKEVLHLQIDHGKPGMYKEVEPFLNEIGIIDLTSVSKNQWRQKVISFILEKNRTELLEKVKKYKKLNYKEICQESLKENNISTV